MPFLKIDGYDEHGIEMGWGTWTKWKITTKVNGQLEIYNTGIQHQSQQVSIGKQGYHKQGNLMVYSTGSVLRAGHNNTSYAILDIGVQDANSSYQGDAYIDVRPNTSTASRFHFKRDGEFIASGVNVSGDVGGTGDGGRITLNGTGYLLSGEAGTEADTLQTVTDRGNSTTNNISISGGSIFGDTVTPNIKLGNAGGAEFNYGTSKLINGGSLVWQGGGVEKFRVTAAGNVGIGSNAPTAHLTIAKTNPKITLFDTAGANTDPNGEITFNETATSENFAIKYNGANDRLEFNSPLDGNTGIMVITRSQKVGIGTTNPDHQLTVAGTGIFMSPSADTNNAIRIGHNSSLGAGGASQMGLWAIGAGKMWLKGYSDMHFGYNKDVTIKDGGNVGIGTTNPVSALHVIGDGGDAVQVDDGYLRLRNTSSNDALQIQAAVGSEARIVASNFDLGQAHPLKIAGDYVRICTSGAAANTEVARFTAEGNVGINTTSPKGKLHIEGNKSYSLGYLDATSDLHIGNDTMSSAVGAYAGSISFGSTDESNLQAASIVAIQTDTDPNEIGLAFFTQHSQFGSTNLAESMRISNDGNIIAGDNKKFKGTTYSSSYLSFSDDTTLSANSDIVFHINGSTELMRIDEVGKVGIGTSSPSSTLQVAGQVRIDGSTTAGLTITSNAGASRGLEIFNISSTDTAKIINYYNGPLILGQSNSDVLTIDNDSVGINVSAPAGDKLMVKGEDGYFASRLDGSTTAGQSHGLRVRAGYNSTDRPVLIEKADGSDIFIIDGLGNVGIGTTSPAQKLDVNAGHILLSSNSYDLRGVDTGGTQRTLVRINSSNEAEYGSSLSGPVKFMGGGSYTERMRIHTNGYIGIGSSSPSYKLDVVGTTRSTYYIGGAYLEENASSSKLKFYSDGTILVMDEDGELKPCEKENDALVFGVSKKDFDSPVVLGAEPVLVTGPIKVGDYIVTSNKQGHGQSMKEQNIGTIIAQAMESGDGESYNIKAMVRKM